MKATTLLSSILGAVSAVTFSPLPSFAILTTVPITGVSFNVTSAYLNLGSFVNGTALNPLGTIVFSSTSNIAIGFPSGRSSNGQPITFAAMSSTGTISGRLFTNAPLNLTGTILSRSIVFLPATTTLVNTIVTGGTISLSTKLVASLTPTSLIPPQQYL